MIEIIEQKHKAHQANKAQQAQKANQVHLEQMESMVWMARRKLMEQTLIYVLHVFLDALVKLDRDAVLVKVKTTIPADIPCAHQQQTL